MPIFMNPFQKHDVSDFPDTYVPLAHAERHASVVAAHKEIDIDKKDIASESPTHGSRDVADNEYSAYTIEGLKAEIDLGMRINGKYFRGFMITVCRYCCLRTRHSL